MTKDRNATLRLLIVVALVGLALRPFLTGVGPVTAPMRAETGLSLQGLSALTLVPILLMGAGAFFGPAILARLGAKRATVLALVILGFGSGLRLVAHSTFDLLGSAVLLGLGAAGAQAAFPAIIKREFQQGLNLAMGLYASMMMGGGAFGAQAAPLIAAWSGSWRLALGWLAVPALMTALLAALVLPSEKRQPREGRQRLAHWLRLPRVWLLMACFGLINGGYSSSVAWISPTFQELGWSAGASGGLLALLAVGQAVSALLIPALANRSRDHRPWLALCLAMQIIGFAMLILRPEAAPHMVTFMLGAGLGGCFSLMMIVALDHLPGPAEAGTLAALMQGGGFLLAALPPWVLALLHDLTGSFTAGWALHLAAVLVVSVLILALSPADYGKAMQRLDVPACPAGDAAPAE